MFSPGSGSRRSVRSPQSSRASADSDACANSERAFSNAIRAATTLPKESLEAFRAAATLPKETLDAFAAAGLGLSLLFVRETRAHMALEAAGSETEGGDLPMREKLADNHKLVTFVKGFEDGSQTPARIDWMAPSTKEEALKKVKSIVVGVGYPDTWRDYASIEIGNDAYAVFAQYASNAPFRLSAICDGMKPSI